MFKALLSSLVLLAIPLSAQAQSYTAMPPWTEEQPTTRARPTTDKEGMSLVSVAGYRVTVCAVDGLLVGTGELVLFVYVQHQSRIWEWSQSKKTFPMVPGRCTTTSDIPVIISQGRLLPAALNIGVTAGNKVRVTVESVIR